MTGQKNHVLVGVVPGQPVAVVINAARFAEHFHAHLVCACVDAGRVCVGERPDGTVISLSVDPDLADERAEVFAPKLKAEITAALEGSNVPWSVRALAGAPAQELSRLANELDAAMIVVGTRETGIVSSVREFFNGSIAAHLSHRQHRPVVVVPLNPVGHDGTFPWNEATE